MYEDWRKWQEERHQAKLEAAKIAFDDYWSKVNADKAMKTLFRDIALQAYIAGYIDSPSDVPIG